MTITPSLRAELEARENGANVVPLQVEQPRHSWTPIDLVSLGDEPPEPPTLGGLAYPGRRHVFSGEPEALKSWLTLVLSAEEMRAGRSVVYIDLEMGPRDTLARLRNLQLRDADISAHFIYLNPHEPLKPALGDVETLLIQRRPSLVVIDAFAGALALHGLDGLKSADVERFYRDVVDPLRAHGAAVVILDHLPKAIEGRGKWAIGSERKIGACDVHLGLEMLQPFGRGRTGRAKIVTHKDRPGYLPRPKAGELELVSDEESELITWQIRLAEREQSPEPFRPTCLMKRVSEYLEAQAEPVSRNVVEQNIKGKAAGKRLAMDILIADGYLEQSPGPFGAHLLRSVRPYRESDELSSSPRPNLVPTSSRTNTSTTSSPRPSPYKGDEDEDEHDRIPF
jgi:hypothetical protein